MRGGYLHNDVILKRIETALRDRGASVVREQFVSIPNGNGYIDLFADVSGTRIAIEAELTTRRCMNDIAKAIAADAHELWIVTPNARTATAVREFLASRTPDPVATYPVFVLTLGQALQELTNRFSLITASNAHRVHK